MEEDDNTARERQQLRKEREKLQIATNNIKELENSADDDEDTSNNPSTQTIDIDYRKQYGQKGETAAQLARPQRHALNG